MPLSWRVLRGSEKAARLLICPRGQTSRAVLVVIIIECVEDATPVVGATGVEIERRRRLGPGLWDDLAMVATYDEFAAGHRAQHLKPFNRWCAVVGNPLSVVGGASMLLGHRRSGAALAGSGLAILGAGHVAEGNLPRSLRDLARHPIWSVRADFALARDTIMDSRSRP